MSCRHDHDRLLFDFFIRLVQDDAGIRLHDNTSVAELEDVQVRPTLETILRFPKSDLFQAEDGVVEELEASLWHLLTSNPRDIRNWLNARGAAPDAIHKETQNNAYVHSQLSAWTIERVAEGESEVITRLGMFPEDGKCDALGRLLVGLPDISFGDFGQFPLVNCAAPRDRDIRKKKDATKSSARSDGIPIDPI